MKKLITGISFIVLFSFTSNTVKAQDVGTSQFRLGVGIGGLGLNADYERIIMDNIGVGVYAAFTRRSYGALLLGSNAYKQTELSFGARGAYHFNELLNIPEKFDLYAAVGLGLQIRNYDNSYYDYYGGSGSSLGASVLSRVGGSMKLSDKMGIFSEIGYGPSWVTAGIKLGM